MTANPLQFYDMAQERLARLKLRLDVQFARKYS